MFFPVLLIGWKKYATLLPKYCLAETPQALVPSRLGRQSAERERISGISWNVFLKKLQAGLFGTMFNTRLSFMFFPVLLIGWKKYATLLPKNCLAETPQALVPRKLGRQSAERERISEISWNVFLKKLQAGLFGTMFNTRLSFMFFPVLLIGWKKYATLL
ncbi:hypothetical protein MZM54_20630, partial [[Brevibacterium] frigoritolerans]|nr:hypothetical protein [Peribacillus frigoritolerans]